MEIIEAPDDSDGDARCYRREGYHGVNGDAVADLDSDHVDCFWGLMQKSITTSLCRLGISPHRREFVK